MKRIPLIFKFLYNIAEFIIWITLWFGFLALCNWDLNIGGWNGFSRFLLGVGGLILLILLYTTMDTNVKKHRIKKDEEKN